MNRSQLTVVLSFILIAAAGCGRERMNTSTIDSLKTQVAAFAPVEIVADVSRLSPGDQAAVRSLNEASQLLDSIYLHQVWQKNAATFASAAYDHSPEGDLRRQLLEIHRSPWSGTDNEQAFIPGVPARPSGANYYPEDMTKEEFERWVGALSAQDQERARGYFTVIRRNADRSLSMVPFNVEYRRWLEPAAALLKDAARSTTDATLRKFLNLRADAFLSNDYYASDVAWMELDSPVEPTIGPYEVYMDGLFNYKAAFESYIAIRDDQATAALKMFGAHLQEIEDHLPIDPKYRNPKLGASAPIRVVDLVGTGGEARSGVQTAAFNLPNDERVVKAKGSKRVMLKNVQEAKFTTVLTPIAKKVLAPELVPLLSFDQFFTHILAHELMHGLGPHSITVNGRTTTVRQQMRELSSAFEEAKADVAGLFALQYLMSTGVVDRSQEHQLYATYLAGVFRSIRFGAGEAHGRGMALQFNYLVDKGAITADPAHGTFSVAFDKIASAVETLTGEIMTIQAEGSYEKAKAMLDTYGVVRPETKKILDGLTGIPIDIAPRYVIKGL